MENNIFYREGDVVKIHKIMTVLLLLAGARVTAHGEAIDQSGTVVQNIPTAIFLKATFGPDSTGMITAFYTDTPMHGTLTPPVIINAITAIVVYTPDLNYVGPDQFFFWASDSTGIGADAAVDITVTPAPPEQVVQFEALQIALQSTNPVIRAAALSSSSLSSKYSSSSAFSLAFSSGSSSFSSSSSSSSS